MKKSALIFPGILSLFFLISSVNAAANPAAVYCNEMNKEFGNYEYRVVTAADGSQSGVCILPDASNCEEWDFLNGRCGTAYSYCEKEGYEMQGANCVINENGESREVSVSELMALDEKLGVMAHPSRAIGEVQARMVMAQQGFEARSSLYNASSYSYWDWRSPPSGTVYSNASFTFFDSTYGWTTSVKDQGGCGSCWAFSTDGSLEATYELNQNNSRLNPDLSEQYSVTYDTSSYLGEQQYGCSGGWMDVAMRYIMQNGTVDEACDPYAADDSSTRCSDYTNRLWNISNYTTTYEGIETILQLTNNQTEQWLIDYGPMAAALYASQLDGDGTIERCTAAGDAAASNHGVVITGYNNTGNDSTSYWILKNSWGTGWGNSGYFKLGFGECNITSEFEFASYVNPPQNYKPSAVLNSPATNNITGSGLITFNFTTYNKNATNATCDLIINGVIRNTTSSAVNATAKTLTYNLSEGNYNWSISCWENNLGIVNSSETRLLQVGAMPPSLTIISPANTTYTTRQIAVNITNSSDAVYVWWNNGTNNLTYSGAVYYNFSEGSHTIYAYANDSVNNVNTTSVTFSVDSINPAISFTSQTENSSSTFTTRNNIVVNVTASDTNLANITLNLYNSTSIVNSTTTNSTSIFANFTGLGDNVYYINATACDRAGNYNYTETRNVTIDIHAPALSIISPINKTWYNAVRLNLTLNEASSCFFSLNNQANASMSNLSSTSWYFVNSSVSETSTNRGYNVTIYCNDTAGNLNTSALIFFGVHKTAPNITLISPDNGYSATGTTTASFQFNVTDALNISSCSLIVDSAAVASNSSAITNGTNTISKEMTAATYSWSINCTDEAGNTGNSSSRSLVINAAPSVPSSGGGGGGGGGGGDETILKTFVLQPGQPAETELKMGMGSIAYSVSSENHTIRLSGLLINSIELTIASSPIKVILNAGETKQVDVNRNGINDLELTLLEMNLTSAKIRFKPLFETTQAKPAARGAAPENITPATASDNLPTPSSGAEKVSTYGFAEAIKLVLILVTVCAIALFIIVRAYKHKQNRINKK